MKHKNGKKQIQIFVIRNGTIDTRTLNKNK